MIYRPTASLFCRFARLEYLRLSVVHGLKDELAVLLVKTNDSEPMSPVHKQGIG